MMKNLLTMILCLMGWITTAQTSNPYATTPTDELYGYYQNGNDFENLKTKINLHFSILRAIGLTSTEISRRSDREYTLLWKHKTDDNQTVELTILYQFLVPYFKVTMQNVTFTTASGYQMSLTHDLADAVAKSVYGSYYDITINNLLENIRPAKTFTKQEFQQALKTIDQAPSN